jgi:carboxymethylenebutenolidase
MKAERCNAEPLTQGEIDQRVFDLYDEYCHGRIDRRAFLQRAAVVTVGGLAMAQALLPRYAEAQTVSFTDERPAAPPAPCADTWYSPRATDRFRPCW